MAATARPPGIGDARMPCPLCGGLIHPVAGRCKHCKEDLTSFRAGRPQAAATLPALNGAAISAPVPSTLHTPGPTNGFAPPVPTGINGHAGMNGHAPAVPQVIPQARDGSQPILPPRQTGSWHAKDSKGPSLWRSWPMLVIGVAVLAIVTAVVIMVLPQDAKRSGGKKIGAPPPAPERMDVDPTHPKSSQLTPPQDNDPWAQPDQDPTLPRQPAQPPQVAVPDPTDPNDLFGSLGGGGNQQMDMMLAVVNRACKKLKTCPGADLSSLDMVCSQFANRAVPAPSCDAAKRCYDAIDALPCDQDADVSSALSMTDCVTAMNGC